MAYTNYLVKFGTYTIPLKFIKADTYKITQNGQDYDSYRDANGVLHRTALSHVVYKVEFETPPLMTDTEKETLMSNIRGQYTNSIEKKGTLSAYNPETGTYITQDVYMPDIEFSIYGIFGNEVKYNSFRIAFIGY